MESTRYSELQSDKEKDEINENEKPAECFPPTKENPNQYMMTNIFTNMHNLSNNTIVSYPGM